MKVNGTQFYLKGEPFYFAGANSYYLWFGNYNCTSYDYNQGCSKEVFDDAKALNLTVLRTWGFLDGYNYWGSLQPTAGNYNEADFVRFDRMVKEAGDHGFKLIIPFVNNWNDFGGMCQYVKWCNITNATLCNPNTGLGTAGAIAHDTFYTDSCIKNVYKN